MNQFPLFTRFPFDRVAQNKSYGITQEIPYTDLFQIIVSKMV